jgi:hypothetical protein
MRPAHFFAPSLTFDWRHVEREEIFWEVFHGRLLDPAHTRRRRTFESWSLYLLSEAGRSDEPLLALQWDHEAGQLFVVRGIDSYVWEGYDSGGNVYLTRERRKWVRELTGVIPLKSFIQADELLDELICQLFHAVVGASRLPLSSVEAPMPGFSFGQLFYCYRPAALDSILRTEADLLDTMLSAPLAWLEKTKLLETFLHATDDMETAAERFHSRWLALGHDIAQLLSLLRTLYNEVSLSPYTDLVEKTLRLLAVLEARSHLTSAQVVDFLGYLLRQIGRHVTAYDLVTFHHRGANYPDALLLDAVLKAYLNRIECCPTLFEDAPGTNQREQRVRRMRRRALRQGWLLRRRHEGHPVPDHPTSPGESTRVLPASHPRVPEEQVLQPARRTRRLYADDPLAIAPGTHTERILRQSLVDLGQAMEAREMGMALFLDRPFGVGKNPAEPDSTLLLSSEAFSRSIAEERMGFLVEQGLASSAEVKAWAGGLDMRGLPLDRVGGPVHAGAIALADARRVAPDFLLVRTTPSSMASLRDQFDFSPLKAHSNLAFLTSCRPVLLARSPQGTVILYDEEYQPRIELAPAVDDGFVKRAGREYPAKGLRVLNCWPEGEGPTNSIYLAPQ